MLKCLIIDDDAPSLALMKTFFKEIPFLELSATFPDTPAARSFLKINSVDLIFLNLSSAPDEIPAVVFLQRYAMVILTSANAKFAMHGFEHNVFDYLIKPFEFERFYKSVSKAYTLRFHPESRLSGAALSSPSTISSPAPTALQMKGGYIFIKEATRILRVELDDIQYIMSLKNYVSIHTKTHRIVSLQTMKQMEDMLPVHRFARVHRSYFVALDKIVSIEKQQILIKDKLIPIGNIYLNAFMLRLSKTSH